jgi:hypothetical protein
MPSTDLRGTAPTRPYLREGLLLLAFVALVVLSAFTVAMPELSREPDTAATGTAAQGPKPLSENAGKRGASAP